MTECEGFPFPFLYLFSLPLSFIKSAAFKVLRFCVNAGPRSIEPDNDSNSRTRAFRSGTPEETPRPAHGADHGAFCRDLLA
jgi:hypothetical protein